MEIMDTRLECPYCRYTLKISEWNEKVKEAVMLGVCDQLIPTDLQVDEWEKYRNEHGGRCDCPECGEVASFDDMTAY